MVIELVRQYTWHDVLAMPEDGNRYEVIAGEMVMTPAPGSRHQTISTVLMATLSQHLGIAGSRGRLFAAPTDLLLAPDTMVEPDLIVLARPLADLDQPRLTAVPLLVVEILSPSTRARDLHTKQAAYARHGIPHYWVVDPEAPAIAAFSLREGDYVKVAEALPGQPFAAEPFPDLALDTRLLLEG